MIPDMYQRGRNVIDNGSESKLNTDPKTEFNPDTGEIEVTLEYHDIGDHRITILDRDKYTITCIWCGDRQGVSEQMYQNLSDGRCELIKELIMQHFIDSSCTGSDDTNERIRLHTNGEIKITGGGTIYV